MRRAQKKQAVELVQLLGRVHGTLRKIMETDDMASAMKLLEQCQNVAIKLGEMIERTEGEGFATISVLEEYCELIYQIYEAIAQGGAVDGNEAYQCLCGILMQIENSIHNDISIRREVVFLPYKASEWDSLESVWKAAEEDPDCDAYVIPIPYYYKNPDGSFCEMQYEGDQYPEEVPITKYDEFDFGQHQPDMIFIHNPYDEYNHATSVHPFFYSANLKKFTENLIYIPYFVLDEISPNEERVVGSMEYFAAMPGVVNADKVIVQSEKMRQSYIDFLSKAAGEETREIWEKKILGLGSPKLDKNLNIKEDLEIPEEWLKVIQKPDGSWKKIILYYTSVSTLYEYGEKALDKMRGVLQFFKNNQDDTVLLWHQDSSIESGIEFMPTQLGAGYRKIAEGYKAEGWGIYDDSADMNRAVMLGDAYYGDVGRVMQLYRRAGKPIMMQDVYTI